MTFSWYGAVEAVVVSLALLSVIAGCSAPDPREDPASTTEAAIEIAGSFDAGDAQSDWTAAFDGSALVKISERVAMGDYGESTATFFFEDADLVRYESSERRRRLTGAEEAAFSSVELRIGFRDGRVVGSNQSVDGSAVEPETYEIEGALRRAGALREQVLLRRTEGLPRLRCQGNEPFWNLTIRDTEGAFTAMGEAERSLTARWQWNTATTPATLDWKATHRDDDVTFFFASIREETCLDTMSDETPPFRHRIDLMVTNRGTVTGCCRAE